MRWAPVPSSKARIRTPAPGLRVVLPHCPPIPQHYLGRPSRPPAPRQPQPAEGGPRTKAILLAKPSAKTPCHSGWNSAAVELEVEEVAAEPVAMIAAAAGSGGDGDDDVTEETGSHSLPRIPPVAGVLAGDQH